MRLKQPSRSQSSAAWILTRKIIQYLALLTFVVLFIAAHNSNWSPALLNLPMRLDPLLMLAHLLSSRIFLVSSLLALLTLFLALIFGRAWCGWLCPLGTVLDLFSLKRWRSRRKPPPDSWRAIKYVLLVAIFTAALLGNLTLLVLDPLTLLFRFLTSSLWPALDQMITGVESVLYRVPFLSTPVSAFDAWLRPSIFPAAPIYSRSALLFAMLFLGVIALNLWAPRFWCRYLCPLGGLLGLLSKVALFRRQVAVECKGCTACTRACPTGTINPAKGYASDPSECTLCLDCMEACPRGLVTFNPGISLAPWNEYDPNRRLALLSIGTAVFGVAFNARVGCRATFHLACCARLGRGM